MMMKHGLHMRSVAQLLGFFVATSPIFADSIHITYTDEPGKPQTLFIDRYSPPSDNIHAAGLILSGGVVIETFSYAEGDLAIISSRIAKAAGGIADCTPDSAEQAIRFVAVTIPGSTEESVESMRDFLRELCPLAKGSAAAAVDDHSPSFNSIKTGNDPYALTPPPPPPPMPPVASPDTP